MRLQYKIILLSAFIVIGLLGFYVYYLNGDGDFNKFSMNLKQGSNLELLNINQFTNRTLSWEGMDKVLNEDQKKDFRSFILSFSVILVSEIGDKTFFIAALLAMKHNCWVVFFGAYASLFFMSFLSAFMGHACFNFIPKIYVTFCASILFLIFGIKMGVDGWNLKADDELKELHETEEELLEQEANEKLQVMEEGKKSDPTWKTKLNQLFSPVFVQAFILTFLAEWGDRSQISTIALAAAGDMLWVAIGSALGHSLCTLAAALGGRYLATRISVKKLTFAGAALFILFGIIYLTEAVYERNYPILEQSLKPSSTPTLTPN